MFSIFRQNKEQGVPEWASFFSPKEYSTFIRAVEDYLNRKKFIYTLRDGIVDFEEDDILDVGNMGLSNLAQSCKQNRRSDYKAIVSDHFDSMFRNFRYEAELKKVIEDFDQIEQLLGFRIYNNDYVDHIGREKVIGNQLTEDLFAMLVLDLPEAITNVQLMHAEHWNKSDSELIEIGKRNIRAKYDFPILRELISDNPFYAVTVDHFFSSNVLFHLEEFPELIGKYGSIISFPHRHTTLIYPVEDISITYTLGHLMNMTYGMCVEGPGSISKAVYWLNNGNLIQVPYAYEDDRLTITPPDEFVQMLNSLPEQ